MPHDDGDRRGPLLEGELSGTNWLERRHQRRFDQHAGGRHVPDGDMLAEVERGPQLAADVEPEVLPAIAKTISAAHDPDASRWALTRACCTAVSGDSDAARNVVMPTRTTIAPFSCAPRINRPTSEAAASPFASGMNTPAPRPTTPTTSDDRTCSWTTWITSSS